MTTAVATPRPAHTNAMEAHCAALEDIAKHLEGIAFDRATYRLTGLSPASLGHIKAKLPMLDVAHQFTALECWLMCNPAPADLAAFTADRLLTNSSLAAYGLLDTADTQTH
jgi:hypothetical protein